MNGYDDIINLPHYVSNTRPHMSMEDRAAQFSAFDCLTGFGDTIDETARQTDSRIELSEQDALALAERIRIFEARCAETARMKDPERLPDAEVTYFIPDKEEHRHSTKTGGKYVTMKGKLRRVDLEMARLYMLDSARAGKEKTINIADIIDIQ